MNEKQEPTNNKQLLEPSEPREEFNWARPIWCSPPKVDSSGQPTKICVIPACARTIVARHLCMTHYQAVRRGALDPSTGKLLSEIKKDTFGSKEALRADEGEGEERKQLPELPACYGSLSDYVYIGYTEKLVNIKMGLEISRHAAVSAWGRWINRVITDGLIQQFPKEVWSPHPNFDAGNNYNSYRIPASLIPDESWQGSLDPKLEKLLRNLSGPSEQDYSYLLNWLAYKFQNPHAVPCALILHGAQGSGKGTLTALLNRIFSPYFAKITGGALENDFTGWLYKKLLIVANEVNVSTNKDRHNTRKRLKDYTAPDTIDIHMKYAEHFNTQNHAAWIICSNDKYVVDIESDDRRYSVLHSDSTLSFELGYEISEANPDYYAHNLFNALYRRDVTGFRASFPHENGARQAMKAKFSNSFVRVDADPIEQ